MDFFQQFSELQRMAFNNIESLMSSMQNINFAHIPDNMEKTLEFQEESIKIFLDFQENISRFSISTQRRIWESYFKMLRRMG